MSNNDFYDGLLGAPQGTKSSGAYETGAQIREANTNNAPKTSAEPMSLATGIFWTSLGVIALGYMGLQALVNDAHEWSNSWKEDAQKIFEDKAEKKYNPKLLSLAKQQSDAPIQTLNSYISQSECHAQRTSNIMEGKIGGFFSPCGFNDAVKGYFEHSIIGTYVSQNKTSANLSYNIQYDVTLYPLTPYNLDYRARHTASNYDRDDVADAINSFSKNKLYKLMQTRPGQCAIMHSFQIASAKISEVEDFKIAFVKVSEKHMDVTLTQSQGNATLLCLKKGKFAPL